MERPLVCVHCNSLSERRKYARTRMCRPCAQQHKKLCAVACSKVGNAIRRGLIPPAKAFACVDCGGPARDYDHRDYSKPLAVEPVCHPCNLRRGPATWGAAA
jgi:hypothetical protein